MRTTWPQPPPSRQAMAQPPPPSRQAMAQQLRRGSSSCAKAAPRGARPLLPPSPAASPPRGARGRRGCAAGGGRAGGAAGPGAGAFGRGFGVVSWVRQGPVVGGYHSAALFARNDSICVMEAVEKRVGLPHYYGTRLRTA